ncbi:MAG TPA: thiamine phosphate synthase [Candidatus Cybelea sp.]|nr:thiamine phosphate synthase [Candidatus Cybelea sp.]
MTDERRLPDPVPAIRRLPRGSGVIFRNYGDASRRALAAVIAPICRERRIMLLVAGDAVLAAAVRADGVHWPEASMRRPRRRMRPRWIVSVAAHSLPAIRRARGADQVLLSPVFATASHPGAEPLGTLRFAALCRRSGVPVVALGGIDDGSAQRLRPASHAGFAAIGALA